MMRKLGYPVGWLLEAQVKENNLSVVDGLQENGAENSEEPKKEIEYDPDRIYSFPGFNEPPPSRFKDVRNAQYHFKYRYEVFQFYLIYQGIK